MALGRRRIGTVPTLIGKTWNDAARPLYEALRKLWASEADGIPSGFNNVTPTTIQAGIAASPGTENQGWMAADATLAISTGAASGLEPDSTNTEGTGSTLARADHTHDMSKVMADVMSKISLGF